jgi:hypothetical protein
MHKGAPQEILPANLLDHRAVRAWQQLAAESSSPQNIEILKLTEKSAVYRLTGVAADGSTIIAKRCLTATATVERMIYENYLPQVQGPALRYYGFVEESDGKFGWLLLEDANRGEYVRASEAHRAMAGRWLGIIHAAAMKAGRKDPLPSREPAHYLKLLETSRKAMRDHVCNPALPEEDAQMLDALATDCDLLESHWKEIENICANAPRTIVHGDLVIKNVRVRDTADGPALLVFDWENAGWGVPGADLAQFVGTTISPDLETYSSTLREFIPGTGNMPVHELAECGKFFRLLDDINWDAGLLTFQSYLFLLKHVSCLRVYHGRLREALRAVNWTN